MTWTSLKHLGIVIVTGKVRHPSRITCWSPMKIRKWNQFNQFRLTSTKVISIEKTLAGHISTMKDQQSYIPVSAAYPIHPHSNRKHQPRHGNSIPCKVVWYIHKDKKQPQEKKPYRTNQAVFLQRRQGNSFNPIYKRNSVPAS